MAALPKDAKAFQPEAGPVTLAAWRDEERRSLVTLPVTTLDPRYSDPNAVATGWDETCRVLEEAQVFWISTVRSDGRPHVTPCAAVWREGILYFDTGTTQQKAINLRSNPHVVLTTGCNHWDRGLDVVVEGDAVRVSDDELLKDLAAVWATRWDGTFQFVARDGYFRHAQDEELPPVLVFSVRPTQVLAFGRGARAGHTTHRF
jgi:nitroimidazol reductase NimA-like FMN-containing flavoprotein (pyridoxamine 5'-phosphate oxidase superfamily)